MALHSRAVEQSRELYGKILDRWNREPLEVKQSTQGQVVGLELAIQAASMHLIDGSMPQAPVSLLAQIEKMSNDTSNQFAGKQTQLERARKLAELVEPSLVRAR